MAPETFAPISLGTADRPAPPGSSVPRTAAISDPDERRSSRSRPAPRSAPTQDRPAPAPRSVEETDPLGGLPPALEPEAANTTAAPAPEAALAAADGLGGLPPALEPEGAVPAAVAATAPVVAAAPAAAASPAPTPPQLPSAADVVDAPQPLPRFAAAPAAAESTRVPPVEFTPAPAERKAPTWGDVVAAAGTLPPLEGEPTQTTSMAAATRDPGAATTSHLTGASDLAARDRLAPGNGPACDYDDRHRRVIDFRLPGLDGRTLRLSDIDADLILLDFWGTWCQPCLKSIPHMVDLRSRTPGKTLQIVGIACESEAPDVSARKVKAKADALRINYPLMLSRNDGSCPVQEALHVQALPTLILLDRQGRILWRGEGATPATLARLDHMIASATNTSASRVTR
ncbi:MAG: redoxin domain-containing protein [Isosphaeraceae bacterium]